jgi:hypothetical protein
MPKTRLGRLWAAICAWFKGHFHRYLASRLESHPELAREVLADPAKRALKRAVLAGLCPPDTMSMGICNGGPALYFKHDAAQEVFIGKTYEDAVDHFLWWLREMQRAGPAYAPTTKSTTKLSRHERRAYASKKFRNKQKQGSKSR